MPKNSIKQIQQDEKKILKELSKNANKSINDIAKTCGFSRQKVWRVIKNLEKNHTIWGYTAILDEEKIGKKSFLILIKRTSKALSEDIINKILRRDLIKRAKKLEIDILNSYFTHGIYDWVIRINAIGIREVKGLVEEINKLYQGYIIDIHLLEIMFTATDHEVSNPEIKKLKDFIKV